MNSQLTKNPGSPLQWLAMLALTALCTPTIIGSGWGPPAGIYFYNRITAPPPSSPQPPPPYLYDQVVIRRNVIHSLDGVADPFPYASGMRLDMCAKGIVEETIIDLNSTTSLYFAPIWQVRCDSITYLGNQTSAGARIPGQIEISEPPPLFTEVEELSTLIDLACIQCF